jgi:hypothetical protein
LARCLIIGCGCRGRSLAAELRTRGHAVRGTTRDARTRTEIEAVGAEAYVGDPDRVATLTPALDHVTVACVLLGTAAGPVEHVAALHGSRLQMLLQRMLDTTVRGILYEAAGSVDPSALREGARTVRAACEANLIPYVILDAAPSDHAAWVGAARDAVERLLLARY